MAFSLGGITTRGGCLELPSENLGILRRSVTRIRAANVCGSPSLPAHSAIEQRDRTTGWAAGKHERRDVVACHFTLQCHEALIPGRACDRYLYSSIQRHVRCAEQVSERAWVCQQRCGESLENERRAPLHLGIVTKLGDAEEKIDRERGSRRCCVVGRIAWPGDQRLGVAGRIEEGAGIIVPEPFDHGMREPGRACHPRLIERQLVYGDESQGDSSIVLEESIDLRDSGGARAHDPSIPDHLAIKKFRIAKRESSEVIAPKHAGCSSDTPKHQPVPARKDFLVPAGPDAPCAR